MSEWLIKKRSSWNVAGRIMSHKNGWCLPSLGWCLSINCNPKPLLSLSPLLFSLYFRHIEISVWSSSYRVLRASLSAGNGNILAVLEQYINIQEIDCTNLYQKQSLCRIAKSRRAGWTRHPGLSHPMVTHCRILRCSTQEKKEWNVMKT